jgi:hypothetical protein
VHEQSARRQAESREIAEEVLEADRAAEGDQLEN